MTPHAASWLAEYLGVEEVSADETPEVFVGITIDWPFSRLPVHYDRGRGYVHLADGSEIGLGAADLVALAMDEDATLEIPQAIRAQAAAFDYSADEFLARFVQDLRLLQRHGLLPEPRRNT